MLLVVRILVLGGVGGHRPIDVGGALRSLPEFAFAIGTFVLRPPEGQRDPAAGWLLAQGALALALAIAVARGGRRPAGPAPAQAAPAAAVALVWMLAVAATYPAAGGVTPWYLFLPVMGWALLAGALAQALAAGMRASAPPLRAAAAVAFVALVGWIAWQAGSSPLLHRYDDWARASRASEEFRQELRARIERAADGSVVQAPPVPVLLRPRAEGPAVYGAAVLADYSIQAWADLVLPERRVRVAAARSAPAPASDEVVVVLGEPLPGFEP
jgi:hypothetical protein